MLYIILAIYAVILISFVLMYFFIVYHFVKYSVNASLNKIILPFFVIISTLLLFSNVFLFFNVDWNELFFRLF